MKESFLKVAAASNGLAFMELTAPFSPFFKGKYIDFSVLHQPFHKQDFKEKENYKKNPKLMFIFLEAFRDPFVTAAEAASQSSSDTRANLHKVEAAEKGLLLVKSAEYTAS